MQAYESNYDFHEVVQRLMRFCSIEMGSFYLDIIKDRQYTAKSGQRGASQLPDRAVPHRGSAGALDGADHVLHRG